MVWGSGKDQGRVYPHKVPGFKQFTGLCVTHLHLTTSWLISGILLQFLFPVVASWACDI